MKKLYKLTAFIFLIIACNNSGNENKTVKSKADSLMDEVMEGHNAAMARMSRTNETQKKVQQAIDSISRLPASLKKNSIEHKIQLDSVLGRLRFAAYAMDRWMEEFNMDSSKNNEELRVKYLESEKIKILKVKNAMISSLQKADSLLK